MHMEYMISVWDDDVNGRLRMVHLGINFSDQIENKTKKKKKNNTNSATTKKVSVVYCRDIYSEREKKGHWWYLLLCVLVGYRWRRMTELWLTQCDKVYLSFVLAQQKNTKKITTTIWHTLFLSLTKQIETRKKEKNTPTNSNQRTKIA